MSPRGRPHARGASASGRPVAGVRSVVMVVVNEAVEGRYVVRRVWLPSRGVESWTVVDPDRCPVEAVDAFLGWLPWIERSPNTVEAYARDLKAFWTFLAARGLAWEAVTVAELGEFAAWARRPAGNVVVPASRRHDAARGP